MIRFFAVTTLFALSLNHGHCQELAKPRAFEVASITPCKPGTPEPPGEHAGMVQFIYPGGRFNAKATTVKFLLEWAYGIVPAEHTGGPSWMGTERFDIAAKAEGNASDHDMKVLAQGLLADRFKLKFHRESREVPVLLVSIGAAEPKLTAPKEGETHSMHIQPQTNPDQKVTSFRVVATRFTLAQLNEVFARQIGRVIVDHTGLAGEYNFAFDLTPDESSPNPLDPTLLIRALREQLGLTVKSQKAPVDVFVIDSVERATDGN